MQPFIRVIKALSDPSRVKIVKALQEQELCVCEITALLGLAQSTISKHLQILEQAGLTTYRKEGSWIIYRLTAGEDSPYARAMLAHLSEWLDDDPQIRELLHRLPDLDRAQLCAVPSRKAGGS